ncbi:hypothetical protein BU15DRAFT_69503 [Melanogaster broomeanus]|nr:hypothetical protein BU15DRAFT_69503 [Melanogaster broomeanus]
MASQTPALFLGLPVPHPPTSLLPTHGQNPPPPRLPQRHKLAAPFVLMDASSVKESEGCGFELIAISATCMRAERARTVFPSIFICHSAPIRASLGGIAKYKIMELSMVIFLSDGIAAVSDRVVQSLFRSAKNMGPQPSRVSGGLSLHATSLAPNANSGCLRGVIEVALEEQRESTVPSDFHEALESVQVVQTFLGVAYSLRKPREALMQRAADMGLYVLVVVHPAVPSEQSHSHIDSIDDSVWTAISTTQGGGLQLSHQYGRE